MTALYAAAGSAIVTALLLPVLIPLLRRVAPDVPNHRSSHSLPIPRGGGIAVLLGVAAGVSCAAVLGADVPWAAVLGVLLVGLLGLADDLRGLSALSRFGATLALAAVAAGLVLRPDDVAGWLAAVVVALFLAGYTHAFNFMDGINAISAVQTILTGLWFAAVAQVQLGADGISTSVLGAALAAGAIAFLPFNAPRARVFLGDVGSYGLGFGAALLAVLAWRDGVAWQLCLAPFLIYVADTGTAFLHGVRSGRSPSQAHRDHVYQRLVDHAGLSHVATALVVGGTSGAVLAQAWILRDHAGASVVLGLVVAVLYLALPAMLRPRVTA